VVARGLRSCNSTLRGGTAEFDSFSNSSSRRHAQEFPQAVDRGAIRLRDNLKAEDPKLYDLQINKMENQDTIYGMLPRRIAGRRWTRIRRNQFRELVIKLVDLEFWRTRTAESIRLASRLPRAVVAGRRP